MAPRRDTPGLGKLQRSLNNLRPNPSSDDPFRPKLLVQIRSSEHPYFFSNFTITTISSTMSRMPTTLQIHIIHMGHIIIISHLLSHHEC
jgi:hypothetical protein